MASGSGNGESAPEYRYLQEISQMMFVFGDVVDPHPDVLKLVEDIVRTQVIEMLLQSRALAARRCSRYLSPEDLLFLIRYDRAKVNRLRTYLSWKDVRKNAKESGGDAGGGGGGGGEVGEGAEEGVDNPIRSRKMKIKLPWELGTLYSEFLGGIGDEEHEEEDEDDIEAHEDSLQRLRDADEATRLMTRDEYVHYSECRQASFTFRKSKKFREFINAGAYLDVKPNDDIIDVLGFLAFEVVRELCVGAIALKDAFEQEEAQMKRLANGSRSRRDMVEDGTGIPTARRQIGNGTSDEVKGGAAADPATTEDNGGGQDANGGSTAKRKEAPSNGNAAGSHPSPNKRTKAGANGATTTTTTTAADSDSQAGNSDSACGLFTMPPAKSSPLKTSHVREAFARLQRDRSLLSSGSGGQAGGLRRTRVFVI